MARIPDLTQERRPTPRAQGGVQRYRGTDTAGIVQQSSSEMNAAVQGAAEEMYRAQKIEQERIDTLRAEEAFNKIREKQLELTLGDAGFGHLKGADAVTRPLLKEYTAKFDDAAAGLEQGLSTDRQKALFKNRSQIARAQYQEEILRHLAREGDNYGEQVYKGTVATELQAASTRWSSPNDVAMSVSRIESATAARAGAAGWTKEYREAARQENVSKVHRAVIAQAIGAQDHIYAKAWFDKYRKDIDPVTAKELERAVEGATQKQLFDGYNADYLRDRDSLALLKKLEGKVLGDAQLDEARKNILHGRIVGRMDRLEASGLRAQAQAERQIGRLIDDANANTLAGMPSTPEQLEPIVGLAKGTALEPEATRMVAIANATTRFAALPPATQANEITRLETAVRADPGKFDRRVLDAYKQIHATHKEMLGKDPVTFAVRQGIAPPDNLDLSAPQKAADALGARYALTDAMSARYGSPNRPLTEPEAKLVSGALAGAGWKEKRDYLGALFQASRGNVRGYSGIMSQVAQDHPLTALAGEYHAKGRPQASDMILQGEAVLRPEKKADGTPQGGTLFPMPLEADMQRGFDAAVRDAYAGRPELRNVMYQASRAIYAKLASDQGVKDTKNLEGNLWEQAVLLATGGVEEHNGRRIPMPYGMDKGTFRDQVRRRTEQMEVQGMLPEGITAAKLQDLALEPVGDGRYAFHTGTGILVAPPRGGKPQIKNADGSVSTERTITIEQDGRHYVIPTIVGGKQMTEDQAVEAFRKGTNKAVGEFATGKEADAFARARTSRLSDDLQPRPLILDFNVSAPYVPSGASLTAPEVTDRDRWMKATGGRLGKGQTQEQAIEAWKRGPVKPTPAGIKSTPPPKGGGTQKPQPGPGGSRG